jgi:hypothetical protein
MTMAGIEAQVPSAVPKAMCALRPAPALPPVAVTYINGAGLGQLKFAENAPLASVVTLVPTWVAVVVPLAQSVTVAPTMACDEPSMTVPATVFAPGGVVPPDEEEAPLDELLLLDVVPPEEELLLDVVPPEEELLLEVVPPEEELLLDEVDPEEELLVPPEELLVLPEELLVPPEELLEEPLDELVPLGVVPAVAGAPPPPPPPHATKVSAAATVNA